MVSVVFFSAAFRLTELLSDQSTTQQIRTVADAAMSSNFSANQVNSLRVNGKK